MLKIFLSILLLPAWIWTVLVGTPAAGDQAVVHAVLFYSPSCAHCHLVITETLPPLIEKYGDQLDIVAIDVTQAKGQSLFLAALQYFNLDSAGVPFLVVGETYLVGSIDIPQQFPVLIERHLAEGGIDWPAIPGISEAGSDLQFGQPDAQLPGAVSTEESGNSPTADDIYLPGNSQTDLWGRFKSDLAGNSLAVLVLLGMLVVLAVSLTHMRRTDIPIQVDKWPWLLPVLAIIGVGVAGYLAYVETVHVEAVCGPVGDCNTVQQSEYARLFGVIPIGILGIGGYLTALLAWGIGKRADRHQAAYGNLALLGITAFGLLSSIYLTFLEPFVIGATCAWCLTSAILMTTLFWLSIPTAKQAYTYLRKSPRRKHRYVKSRKTR